MAKDVQTNIRIPADLKEALAAAAKDSGRSFTAEIVKRLQDSFEWEKVDPSTHPEYAAKLAAFDAMQERQEKVLADLQNRFAEITELLNDGPKKGRKPKGMFK